MLFLLRLSTSTKGIHQRLVVATGCGLRYGARRTSSGLRTLRASHTTTYRPGRLLAPCSGRHRDIARCRAMDVLCSSDTTKGPWPEVVNHRSTRGGRISMVVTTSNGLASDDGIDTKSITVCVANFIGDITQRRKLLSRKGNIQSSIIRNQVTSCTLCPSRARLHPA